VTNIPEFSRRFRLDEIGTVPLRVSIAADHQECAALAARFRLLDVKSLNATASLALRDECPYAEGQLEAQVTQACVATNAPVPAHIVQTFKIRFGEEQTDTESDEIELAFDDDDEMPLLNGCVDLGEAVAQTLALALEPFPRAPDAEATLRAAGVVPEGEEVRGAFAALKDLLPKRD
jgi:uncharacterized metal-binding protein YceD (DUF177 family)